MEDSSSSDAVLPPPEAVISLAVASVLVAAGSVSPENNAYTFPV